MQKYRAQSKYHDHSLDNITNDTNKKHSKKYSLIYEINELKKPVFNVVQTIIKKSKENQYRPQRKMSIGCNKGSNNQRKKHSLSMNSQIQQKVNSILNDSLESKDYQSRVCRILIRKKELLSEQQNIDRLNAKLDFYINDKIGSQKIKELKTMF